MKETARLIIPAWGEVYASKLASITLPAVLAPGNLPALCEMFEVELVIVTETRLFEPIRSSSSFQLVAKLCKARLISLDDLMTDIPGDYGVVLTYALFRGFADLGERMTETYLLFLNADFILSDGSLRHLGQLMLEGKRVIHAPSFRVVLEEVWPELQARVDAATSTLRLPAREMVRLALAHKHQTVKARTVNQRLFHQVWMDQFYWYVDEDTLIGYQWPVALVAIKPERVVTDPVLVWDYGFIPEAAPTAERHFIGDSDGFFMLEPQSRGTGDDLVRPGWTSIDDSARTLSKWTTKEHRECGRQLLAIHAGSLPPNFDDVVAESRAYMAQIYSRLSPTPQPHIGHGHLGTWFGTVTERMKGEERGPLPSDGSKRSLPSGAASPPEPWSLARTSINALQAICQRTFGLPPHVGKYHPLWIDTFQVTQKLESWRENGAKKLLWMSSQDSLFHRLLGGRVDPAALLVTNIRGSFVEGAPYDVCLCELTIGELANLNQLYAGIRPLMKEGGEIVVNVVKRDNVLAGAELYLGHAVFPDIDVSEIHFFGTVTTAVLRSAYMRASRSFPTRPIARALTVSAILILLSPLVRLANAFAARRDSAIFSQMWTSLMIEFTVRRGQARRTGDEPGSVVSPACRQDRHKHG